MKNTKKVAQNPRLAAKNEELLQKYGASIAEIAQIGHECRLSITFVAKFLGVGPSTLRMYLEEHVAGEILPPQYGRPFCDPRRIALQEERESKFRSRIAELKNRK